MMLQLNHVMQHCSGVPHYSQPQTARTLTRGKLGVTGKCGIIVLVSYTICHMVCHVTGFSIPRKMDFFWDFFQKGTQKSKGTKRVFLIFIMIVFYDYNNISYFIMV